MNDLRAALNIVVMAGWLLMQSFSVAHSYGHLMHSGEPAHAAETTMQAMAHGPHGPALHMQDRMAHHGTAKAGQPLDATGIQTGAMSDCCDDTQCKAGEMLAVVSLDTAHQPGSVRSAQKSSSVSWTPGSHTPPPDTAV